MMHPNESSVISKNGETAKTPTTKRKGARKSETSGTAVPKRSVTRASGPLETLFTQSPNPLREPVPPFIWIDFPIQNEILRAPTYVMRLGVGGADVVEIAIDKNPWVPCRLTSGYWWYDWSAITPGKHTIVARMRTSDNRWFKTPPRQCTYLTE